VAVLTEREVPVAPCELLAVKVIARRVENPGAMHARTAIAVARCREVALVGAAGEDRYGE
jgi:hypothetical protein